MKKLLSILMMGAIVAFTSCTKEDVTSTGSGEEVKARVSVQMPVQAAKSRAAFTETPDLSDMRVVLSVMYNGKVVHSETKDDNDFGTGSTAVNFDLRLVTGKQYKIAVWADYGDSYYTVTNAIGAEPKVAMTSTTIDGSNQKYDAYFKIDDITFTAANEVKTFVLKRPFGLVKINTTDYNEPSVKNAGLRPEKYTIEAITVPTELSLLDGSVGETKAVKVALSNVSDTYNVDANPKELSFDYFFASEIQSPLANFAVKYSNTSDPEIVTYDFANIPVRRNYITNITGNILTKQGTIKVTVDPMWETGPVVPNSVEIRNTADLKAAVAAQADGQTWIIYPGDYDMTGAPTEQTNEPAWEYYANLGYQVSQFIINKNDIKVIGVGNPVITAKSNSPSVTLNGQSNLLVRGNNVTVDGLTIHAIEYFDGGANKAVAIEGGNNCTIKNCTIKPAPNGKGGLVLFDKEFTNGTATIENTVINGALSTNYFTGTLSVNVKDVTINKTSTYTSVIGNKAATVFNVISAFVLNIDNTVNLSETVKNAPAGTTIILNGGEFKGEMNNGDPYYTNTVIVTRPMTLKCANNATLSGIVVLNADGIVLDGVNYAYTGKNTIYGNLYITGRNITIMNSNLYADFDLNNCVHGGTTGDRGSAFGFIRPNSTPGAGFKLINNNITTNAMGVFGGNLVNAEISGNTFKNLDGYTVRRVAINDSEMSNTVISNNTFDNRHILIGGDASITGNTWVNRGTNDTSLNALYFWSAFTGTITGNNFGSYNSLSELATGREGITIPEFN